MVYACLSVDPLQTIASGFRIAGLVLGIPSLVALVTLLLLWTQLHLAAPAPASPGESQSLITVLMTGARLLGRMFSLLADASRWLVSVLAVVALASTTLAAGMYWTGRGLQTQETWAKVSATLLSMVLLAGGGLGILSFRRGLLLPISLAAFAGSLYVLWTLWRRAA